MSKTSSSRVDSAHGQPSYGTADWSKWPNDVGFQSHFEQHHPTQLEVKGRIPNYAAGVLYRTGPSSYKVDTKKGNTFAMSHWFDGFSKVHRFQIDPSEDVGSATVSYNSRSNVDKLIDSIRETGTLKRVTFAQKKDPCESFFSKVMSTFQTITTPTSNLDPEMANVGVTLSANMPGLTFKDASSPKKHASGIQTLWAKTDTASFKQLDPETLEPIGLASQATLNPKLKGPLSGAHAKSDPETGDIYNYNLEFGRTAMYRIFHTSASTGETDILATIPGKPAYLHSLFLTKDHVILCVWNSHIKAGGVSVLYNNNILDSIAPFDESDPAVWYVVDRRHRRGLVATYESPAFYCFHTVNAWIEASPENAGQIDVVCELQTYPNLDVLHKFYYDNLLSTAPGNEKFRGPKGEAARGVFRRYRLSNVPVSEARKEKDTAIVEYSAPKNASPELPTINPAYATKPHRYTYGIADRGLSSLSDGLIKWDSSKREAIYWEAFANTPGEPIFIADPEGTAEDDGVLLSVVLDGIKESSFLLCLDAKTMTEVGRAEVGGVVGFGFHGLHIKKGATGAVDF